MSLFGVFLIFSQKVKEYPEIRPKRLVYKIRFKPGKISNNFMHFLLKENLTLPRVTHKI